MMMIKGKIFKRIFEREKRLEMKLIKEIKLIYVLWAVVRREKYIQTSDL